MLAQWVQGFGITSGTGAQFPLDSANPRGLHERQDVIGFNDHWLKVLGGSWWAPPRVREQTWRSINSELLSVARTELDYFHADYSQWFVKDPRLSLLLPLWDRLALQRLPVIIGLREPREVAMSLNVRSGTTLRRGLALWLAYNRAIFEHLGGRSALVVDANTAMHDPYAASVEVAVFCESAGLVTDSSKVNVIAENVEPALIRNRVQRLEGSAERLAADLDDTYHALARRHLRPENDSPESIPLPDWAREALEESTEVWDLIVRNEILTSERDQAVRESMRLYNRIPRRAARAVVPKRFRS